MSVICMGRNVLFVLKNRKRLQAPRRAGMLHDRDGSYWPQCSLLITPFEQGRDEIQDDDGRHYFGRTPLALGHVPNPPPKSLLRWRRVGVLKQIFYERAGVTHPGDYKHTFNKPRGLIVNGIRLVELLRGNNPDAPVILYRYARGVYRVEAAEGCVIDDRGIVLP